MDHHGWHFWHSIIHWMFDVALCNHSKIDVLYGMTEVRLHGNLKWIFLMKLVDKITHSWVLIKHIYANNCKTSEVPFSNFYLTFPIASNILICEMNTSIMNKPRKGNNLCNCKKNSIMTETFDKVSHFCGANMQHFSNIYF